MKIIVALDGILTKEALRFAKILKGRVWGFKLNDLLFDDISIIHKLKKFGKVFADAKLHDIPNTVSNCVRRLSLAGADMITVHASGGIEMMMSARQSAGQSKILAVTILTSFRGDNSKKVIHLAKEAVRAGVDGIICSGHELKYLKNIKIIKVVPGIRPSWYKNKDDQRRIVTPREALRLGADYLVIGRPILNAKDPIKALMDM